MRAMYEVLFWGGFVWAFMSARDLDLNSGPLFCRWLMISAEWAFMHMHVCIS